MLVFVVVGIRQTSYTSSYIRSTINAYMPRLYTRITRSAGHQQTGMHKHAVRTYIFTLTTWLIGDVQAHPLDPTWMVTHWYIH